MLCSNESDETLLAIISTDFEKRILGRFFLSMSTECSTNGLHMWFIYRLD
jgi:hypothetical protein